MGAAIWPNKSPQKLSALDSSAIAMAAQGNKMNIDVFSGIITSVQNQLSNTTTNDTKNPQATGRSIEKGLMAINEGAEISFEFESSPMFRVGNMATIGFSGDRVVYAKNHSNNLELDNVYSVSDKDAYLIILAIPRIFCWMAIIPSISYVVDAYVYEESTALMAPSVAIGLVSFFINRFFAKKQEAYKASEFQKNSSKIKASKAKLLQ